MASLHGIYGLMADDRRDLAEKLLLGELEVMHKVLGEEHAEALAQRYFLGNFYRMLGRQQDSLKVFAELADARRTQTPSDADRADGLTRLMDAQLYVGDKAAAERTASSIAAPKTRADAMQRLGRNIRPPRRG